jgi:hypothetical protein
MNTDARIDRLIITIDDVRSAGHCARGARQWFDGHGLDFRAFLHNGIPARQVLAIGDGLADQVIARTLERRGNG